MRPSLFPILGLLAMTMEGTPIVDRANGEKRRVKIKPYRGPQFVESGGKREFVIDGETVVSYSEKAARKKYLKQRSKKNNNGLNADIIIFDECNSFRNAELTYGFDFAFSGEMVASKAPFASEAIKSMKSPS